MRADWIIREFDACIEKRKAPTKLLSSSYQEEGLYPIVSQEKDLISGYWDNPDDLFVHRKPVVIFGDHTMVVKYIDFDFVVGADGVKILEPKDFLLPKYFFYWVSSVHIKSRGYARHYRYLKEATVPIPSLPEQQRIVDILDQEFAKIDALKVNAEKSLQAAKDLFQATLKKELEPKKGWRKKKIGEICVIYNGGTPSTSNAEYWDGDIQWITPKDMGKTKEMYVSKCERTITQLGVENSSTRILPARSVILSSRAPIGYVAINEVPMATNQGCKGFVIGKELYPEFLYFFLLSSTELLNKLGTGATFKEVSGAAMYHRTNPFAFIKLQCPSKELPEDPRSLR